MGGVFRVDGVENYKLRLNSAQFQLKLPKKGHVVQGAMFIYSKICGVTIKMKQIKCFVELALMNQQRIILLP